MEFFSPLDGILSFFNELLVLGLLGHVFKACSTTFEWCYGCHDPNGEEKPYGHQ